MPSEGLLAQESRFWNKYAASLADIQDRPHSWIFVPFLATTLLGPSHHFMYRHIARPDIDSILDVGCGIGWQCVQGARLGKRPYCSRR